jgi:hypothetical protein
MTDSKTACTCGWYRDGIGGFGCDYPNGRYCPRWLREANNCPVPGGEGKSLRDHMTNSTDLWRARAEYLWQVLDDIDTLSDMAKGDDHWYRQAVEARCLDRFKVGGSNGYAVIWHDTVVDENGTIVLIEPTCCGDTGRD